MARRRHIVQPLLVLASAGLAGFLALGGIVWWREQSISGDVDRHRAIIERYAREQGLPAELVRSVVRAESGGNPRAVSRTGARGLMQLMPGAETDATRRLAIARGDLFDPDYNVRVGTMYLRMMLERFGGDVYLAVAAYNAGPTRIAELRRANPELSSEELIEQFAPGETRAYCRNVIGGRWQRLEVSPRR